MYGGSWQIQIIDEEVVILLALSRAYQGKLVDIVTATTMDQVLSQMDIFNFDLFLLDLDLKGCCSLELLKIMTDRFPDIPVILITTRDTESEKLLERIAAVRSPCCWQLLEKPFCYEKLTGFIDRALRARLISDPEDHLCTVVDGKEKRRCRRFSRFEQINLSSPVTLAAHYQSTPFLATLMDISVGGLGLTTRKKLTVSQLVGFDEKFMHQSGIIVWSREEDDKISRSGIRFT